jgi:hypothetical protein
MTMNNNKIISDLIKIADSLDRKNKFDLSSEVDNTIKALAVKKHPLRDLDDDIKRNLIIFVHDADQSTTKAIKCLKELFRRMKYFDLFDSISSLGLNELVNSLESSQTSLGGAKKRFFELMHGHKATDKDFEDFSDKKSAKNDILEFFNEQSKEKDVKTPEETEVEDEMKNELKEFLDELNEKE